jgi:O-antigen/teichoic acid export membrane protein
MFVAALSHSFPNYFIRFVLSAIAGPSAVTYFSVPFKIIVGFGGFLSASIAVLLPFSAEMVVQGNRERLRDIYLRAAKYNVIVGLPVLALMAIFSRPILGVWMGGAFADNAWLAMSLLCLSSFISSLGTIPVVMAFGLGHSRLVAGFSLIAMIPAAAMAVPLIHLAGVTGAALAAVLASLVWIVFSFYVARRFLGVDIPTHFNQVYKFHVVAGIPLLAATLLFEKLAPVHGVNKLSVALVCALAAYYGLIVWSKWVGFDEVQQLFRSRMPV